MNSNIIPDDVAKLAYQIASFSHKPVEQVVRQAMEELAERILPQEKNGLHERIRDIQKRFAELPVLDWRHPDDILYDENGLPKTDLPLNERIAKIQQRVAALPVLDNRSPEEIVGYDEFGSLPHGN